MKKGFTLIETLIYIALFSTIIFGAIISTYYLIQGSDSLSNKTVTQEEGNFVLRKIDWALTGLTSFSISGASCSQTLSVNKFNFGVIDFRITSGVKAHIEIQELGAGYIPITTTNASTTCLQFTQISANPLGIKASATINGVPFEITKYIRK
jgi:type II secretory pathway pseudopilin PulG